MAKITKSDRAPKGSIHVSTGLVEFDLNDSGTFETVNAEVIASAMMTPYLDVKIDPVVAPARPANYDPLDPHQNPAADHLSIQASDSARAAADANERAIRAAVGGDVAAPDAGPTITETVNATFDSIGVTDDPQFESEATVADEPAPTKPAPPAPASPSTPAGE